MVRASYQTTRLRGLAEKVCHVCQQGRRHGVLEVDQPAIEAIVLHDATELLSKALCKALQGEQLQALDCAGCPLGDEGSQHGDAMSVAAIDPARWGYRDQAMAEVDEEVDAMPVVKAELACIMRALRKAILSISARQIMAHQQARPVWQQTVPSERHRCTTEGLVRPLRLGAPR